MGLQFWLELGERGEDFESAESAAEKVMEIIRDASNVAMPKIKNRPCHSEKEYLLVDIRDSRGQEAMYKDSQEFEEATEVE